ncbi:acetyl/propionyl/methylcrotonyl-CoA carboxylase subunit alpha [Micromonospora musae]|uniref:Biotin/lipoyl-binding protein n=1 Tax=Micromonospora musae TaxID=1894970 RepID=A0A3A9Y0J2_9ACTN|nr:biotin carboxylase N-terminal domain-containing protein [Micromonospora musae]RKN30965.1 biotin/lipoyl-binding protein [Micromonospora musae]
MTINRLLVANRGEIARRVLATCRRLGVETVAVHSDADADAPHVAEADQAVRLPGDSPAETYLGIDRILDAARRTGADAVHPGYGFLAENAEFAAAVIDAGLTWVGPSAKAIAAMGDKVAAKTLLADAGVPMLPTWTEPDQVSRFPVLVKAASGGGGRGMRVVRDAAGLPEAIASARREAAAAFGDGTVFVERYVEHGRHVEVQIFGDAFGTIAALGVRECSIQRRHQKIVEEAPGVIPPEVRERLHEAAVAAGRAVDYVGAGTVEFLLTPDGEIHFLEMNTRLQVEHPVTELCTGLDLVRLQLLVAEGEPLPAEAVYPKTRGYAVEVRLCAEDPAEGFRPATGVLHRFAVAGVSAEFGALTGVGLRLDSGVVDGSAVGVHYDSMLAKLIAWAPTRGEAARALAGALARAELHGVTTNRDLLVRVLRSPEFAAVEVDTGFLDRHPEVFVPLVPSDRVPLYALAGALASAADRRANAPVLAGLPSGWRNVPAYPQVTRLLGPTGEVEVRYRLDRTGALAEWAVRPATGVSGDRAAPDGPRIDSSDAGAAGSATGSGSGIPAVALVSAAPERVVLDADGVRYAYRVHRVGSAVHVDGPEGSVTLTELPRLPEPTAELAPGSLLAPLPGTVTRVHVAAGQRVAAGDLLLTLEAMKLEHPVLAPIDGTVVELPVPTGGQVDTGAVLAVVNPLEDAR